jgi:hypothetical protein
MAAYSAVALAMCVNSVKQEQYAKGVVGTCVEIAGLLGIRKSVL